MTAPADQWVNRIAIKSESSSRLYTISQRAPGGLAEPWYCSCPIFCTRRQIRDGRVSCKHLRAQRKEGPKNESATAAPVRPAARSSFTDADYQHYDPSREGYGSPEEWYRQAEDAAFGSGYRSWSRAEREAERRRAEAEREQNRRERERRHRQRRRPHAPPPPRREPGLAADLVLLELDELPTDARELKAAMRRMAFKVHPDHDHTPGARERFIAMFAAYERLLKRYPS